MADPRTELADIVVPAEPEVLAAGGGLPLWVPAVGLACVVFIALAAWLWRRRRPVRALAGIAAEAAQRQGSVPALAGRLDAWARARFRLARVEAARCPPGVDPAVWSAWTQTLVRLRFAPPWPADFDALAELCRTARRWGRRV